MKNVKSEEKLEKMEIKKLAFNMSAPMVISLLMLSLYNIIDSIFVAKINEDALSAISLSFPIQKMLIGISLGTCIGINSLLSRKLGEKNNDDAKKTVGNGFILMIFSWFFVILTSSIILNYFFNFFTGNKEIVKMGKDYFGIIAIFSIGLFMQIFTKKICESTGMSKKSMIIDLSGAAINLILDPILIFGFLNIPSFGIKGAAIATVIGQIFSSIIGFIILYKNKKDYFLKKYLKLDKEIIKEIYQVGLPSIIMESTSAFLVLILNKVLITISDVAVAYFGVYWKLQDFVITTIYGLNYGMVPIIAYNYGAKNKQRVQSTIKLYMKVSVVIAIVSMACFWIIPKQLLGLFNATDNLLGVGIVGNRILSIAFIFICINLIISSTFQAIGKGKNSLIISLLRRIIINIPIYILFGKYMRLEMVWCVFVLSEIIAFGVAIIMLKKEKSTNELI